MAALDAALALDRQPTVVVGHSMGGALAIRWAATHPDRIQAVVTFGAPLYRTRAEANLRMGSMSPMTSLLVSAGPWPRAACAWMCRHRTVASWLSVVIRPDLPVIVARSGVNHTWASYSGSLDGLVRDGDWAPALRTLNERSIRVVIANGAHDPVPVPGRARMLARRLPSVRNEIRELYYNITIPRVGTPGC